MGVQYWIVGGFPTLLRCRLPIHDWEARLPIICGRSAYLRLPASRQSIAYKMAVQE